MDKVFPLSSISDRSSADGPSVGRKRYGVDRVDKIEFCHKEVKYYKMFMSLLLIRVIGVFVTLEYVDCVSTQSAKVYPATSGVTYSSIAYVTPLVARYTLKSSGVTSGKFSVSSNLKKVIVKPYVDTHKFDLYWVFLVK